MIYFLNEGGNSALLRRKVKAPLGRDIKKHLLEIYNNYNGDKGDNGYKRLENILHMDNEEGGINYNELTQICHVMNNLLPKSQEFKTLGGDLMKTWVEISLKSMENNDKADKEARRKAGESNVFRKAHTKDRQNKRKNKSTIGRFQTKNASKSIANNNFIKLSESHLQRRTFIISEEQSIYLKEALALLNNKNKV